MQKQISSERCIWYAQPVYKESSTVLDIHLLSHILKAGVKYSTNVG